MNHSKPCSSCQALITSPEIIKCQACPRELCHNCYIAPQSKCIYCQTIFCLSCLQNLFKDCTICKSRSCMKCLISCIICNILSCNECLSICLRCNKQSCKACNTCEVCRICKICKSLQYNKCIYCEKEKTCSGCYCLLCELGTGLQGLTKFEFQTTDLSSYNTSHPLLPMQLLTYPKNGAYNFAFDGGKLGWIGFDTKNGAAFCCTRMSSYPRPGMEFAIEWSNDNSTFTSAGTLKISASIWDELTWENSVPHRYWRYRVSHNNNTNPWYHTIEWFTKR